MDVAVTRRTTTQLGRDPSSVAGRRYLYHPDAVIASRGRYGLCRGTYADVSDTSSVGRRAINF